MHDFKEVKDMLDIEVCDTMNYVLHIAQINLKQFSMVTFHVSIFFLIFPLLKQKWCLSLHSF